MSIGLSVPTHGLSICNCGLSVYGHGSSVCSHGLSVCSHELRLYSHGLSFPNDCLRVCVTMVCAFVVMVWRLWSWVECLWSSFVCVCVHVCVCVWSPFRGF